MLIQTLPSTPRFTPLSNAPEKPATPETPAPPAQDSVNLSGSDGPQAPQPNHSLLYRGSRFLVGSVGGIVGGTIGTVIGGVMHAGDNVIPEKLQHLASKVLRPGMAAAGAALGVFVGLSVVPLIGPAKCALLGAVLGAAVGGGLPGATDALLATGKGAICGGWAGRRKGYQMMADAFDKVAAKLQPPTPPTPPAPPTPPTQPTPPPAG